MLKVNLLMKSPARGFTLIELLVVIGIIGILAATVVLIINPLELLRRSRDTQRLTDLKTIKEAVDIYIATVKPSTLFAGSDLVGTGDDLCYLGDSDTTHLWRASTGLDPIYGALATTYANKLPFAFKPFQFPNLPDTASDSGSIPTTDVRKVDGGGWVPVGFNKITIGSPIAKLPLDPINKATNDLMGFSVTGLPAGLFYAYQCKGLTYEINANMESDKFSDPISSTNVEKGDGGAKACYAALGATSASCNALNNPPNQNVTAVYETGGTFGNVCRICGGNVSGVGELADFVYEIGNDPGLDL